MKDFAAVGRRLRRYRFASFLVLVIAAIISAYGISRFLNHGPPYRYVEEVVTINGIERTQNRRVSLSPDEWRYAEAMADRRNDLMYSLLWGGAFSAVGMLLLAAARRKPTNDLLKFASTKQGVVTLAEVATAFDIPPSLAAATLRELQKVNLAIPCWQEIRKNLWEFPDYMVTSAVPPVDVVRILPETSVTAGSPPVVVRRSPEPADLSPALCEGAQAAELATGMAV